MIPLNLENLLPYATARQGHILKVCEDCGWNERAAGRRLYLSPTVIQRTILSVKDAAAKYRHGQKMAHS